MATVGQLEVEPGGINVIPGRVAFSIDVAGARRRAARAASSPRVGLEGGGVDGAGRDGRDVRARSAPRSRRAGLPVVELASGAGHDAGILAAAGVEAGMLFVRGQNGGVSHSPDELASDEDVALAVDVLTGRARETARCSR